MDKKNLADSFTKGETNIEFINMARVVYASLSDDISKRIFEARMMYAMTGRVAALTSLDAKYRNLTSDMECYAQKIKPNSHVIMYGAEGAAHYLAGRFKYFGVSIDAFVDPEDNKGKNDPATGVPIISEKELFEQRVMYSDKTFIISYSKKNRVDEIKQKLVKELGVKEENICYGIYDFRNSQSQYFDYFSPRDNEIFVDCGCYDGGTCMRFIGWCGEKGYDQIYTFEADTENYPKCEKALSNIDKCKLYNYGIAREKNKVYFASRGFETSSIISEEDAKKKDFEGVSTIETISLDEVLEGKEITYLKMDIEGAEYDAILGAKNLIEKNHPRMAISIYHSPEDFVTIPYLLLQLQPDYRIVFRHYALDELETVMYADFG